MSGEALGGARALQLGFFGKLPGTGDFVTRGLPRSFRDPWDAWLQESLAASRNQLGDGWLDCYLTGPIWHFVLSSGICGQASWCGVLLPSVDRVGRYFPMTVAAGFEETIDAYGCLLANGGWFEQVESLLLTVLEEEATSPAELEGRLASIDAPEPCLSDPHSAAGLIATTHGLRARLAAPDPCRAMAMWLDAVSQSHPERYALWWSAGSERVASGLSITSGLPAASSYVAMMDGDWRRAGWQVGGGSQGVEDSPQVEPA